MDTSGDRFCQTRFYEEFADCRTFAPWENEAVNKLKIFRSTDFPDLNIEVLETFPVLEIIPLKSEHTYGRHWCNDGLCYQPRAARS